MEIKFYWDEKHSELWKEIFINGKRKGLHCSKVAKVEIIELDCLEIDGNYYEIGEHVGPLVVLKLIKSVEVSLE